MASSPNLHRGLILVAPFVMAAGLAHLGFQIWKHWDVVTLDLRFFWLAGDFWRQGESPYGPAFADEAARRFGIMKGAIFYYTPNWIAPAVMIAFADPLAASRIVSIANAILLLAACGANVAAFEQILKKSRLVAPKAPLSQVLKATPPWALFCLLAGGMSLSQAAGNTLHLGQSSILIYFGASLLFLGAATRRTGIAAAGFAIVCLKLQIALLFAAGLAFTTFGRRVVVAAGFAAFIMAAPAFAVTPAAEMVKPFLDGISQYQDQAYNKAAAMTGLRHLAWAAGEPDLGGVFYLLVAIIVICAAGLSGRIVIWGGARARAPGTIDMLITATAVILFLAPLHIYDHVLAGVIILPAIALRSPAGAVALAAFLLAWRAGNLPQPALAADVYYVGSIYAAITAGVIFAMIAFARVPATARQRPRAAAARSPGRSRRIRRGRIDFPVSTHKQNSSG